MGCSKNGLLTSPGLLHRDTNTAGNEPTVRPPQRQSIKVLKCGTQYTNQEKVCREDWQFFILPSSEDHPEGKFGFRVSDGIVGRPSITHDWSRCRIAMRGFSVRRFVQIWAD
jgi:hypothetical protein